MTLASWLPLIGLDMSMIQAEPVGVLPWEMPFAFLNVNLVGGPVFSKWPWEAKEAGLSERKE